MEDGYLLTLSEEEKEEEEEEEASLARDGAPELLNEDFVFDTEDADFILGDLRDPDRLFADDDNDDGDDRARLKRGVDLERIIARHRPGASGGAGAAAGLGVETASGAAAAGESSSEGADDESDSEDESSRGPGSEAAVDGGDSNSEAAEDVKQQLDPRLDCEEDSEYGFGMGADSEDESVVGDVLPSLEPLTNFDDLDGSVGSEASEEEEETAEQIARKEEYFGEPDTQPSTLKSFTQFSLSRPLLKALTMGNFNTPTPIQQATIPVALKGKDLVAAAITGSGKTLAFLIPVFERLLYRQKSMPMTRVLILCPTRELGMQCHTVASKLGRFADITSCLCVGGLNSKTQETQLRARPDVVIATPGRFIDHLRNTHGFQIDMVEILIMDEADRMLEDGFSEELSQIIQSCPRSRQTMLFSATMTDDVDRLIKLSLNRPVRLFVDAKRSTAPLLVQEFVRIRPQKEHMRPAYLIALCKAHFKSHCIIFSKSKVFAHRMRIIFGLLDLKAGELHGNLSQEQRVKSLQDFRDGRLDFLLCTDLASRGLDIKNIETVINYEAPNSVDIYLHRVGRTARAGKAGRAITLAGETDRKIVKTILKNSNEQGRQCLSRTVDTAMLEEYNAAIINLERKIDEILTEEKEQKALQQAEMEVRKGQNLLSHEAEIKSKPKRTWFKKGIKDTPRQSTDTKLKRENTKKGDLPTRKDKKRERLRQTGIFDKKKVKKKAVRPLGNKKNADPPRKKFKNK